MSLRPVYLDHHATTPVDPRVLEAMLPWFTERFGNAASISHAYGDEAAGGVEAARQQVAALLDAPPKSIVFTSGATEANNLALKGVLRASRPGSHLITTAAEHRSVLDPARRLEREGYRVTILPVDEFGRVDPQQIAETIRPETVLVSVMAANNEVGTLNPITEIGYLCRERGVLFHCDAVQAALIVLFQVAAGPADMLSLPVDLLSLSAHKLYGPKGVGALYVRRGAPRIRIEAQIDGGRHENRLRSGTLPVPLIVGFGAACAIVRERSHRDWLEFAALRDRLWNGLSQSLEGLHLNGYPSDRLPGNLNVSFEGVDGEALLAGLKRIAVSSGSACTSADPEPSHVLRAMGRSDALTRASLRFGIGRGTTGAEIDAAIEEVVAVVKRLRAS